MTRIMAGTAVRGARISRGLSQDALAREAGISRQALSAIESGAYQPGVAVALRLGRALDRTVESLFGAGEKAEHLSATFAGGESAARVGPSGVAGRPVALARVGNRIVALARPAACLSLAAASGIVERVVRRRADVATLRSRAEIDSTLLIAGCDPAVPILGDWLMRHHAPADAFAVRCSSRGALAELIGGRVHAAGVHIRDPNSGEYNLALASRALGSRPGVLVNFARWELGLAIAQGNPAGIRGLADLARPRLRLVNRPPGSGARLALDESLAELKLSSVKIKGYDREAPGHLEVAAAIAAGEADVGVAIRVAAEAYALEFIPLRKERYDLVIAQSEMTSPPVAAMLDALNSSRFTRELSALCSYDTGQTGRVVARFG
jgi:molybdopterin molybdotransferase/putative molybdopterin biosynthesis protein